ncbi:MAG: hypothetical protein HZB70_01545 [Candidatus Berkelbacteria bacterium]|nr:MAG: hypothetical protein HZB70_01545 [Candidatus Berkelbacteria bacterium]QQG51983.1 MAG: hypothetical protein HY845_01450 [Candidatus Berkelbacteria bacterium]
MSRGKFWVSVAVLVLVNLIPLAGVKYYDWDLATLMFGYWLETLVLCFFSVIKILCSKSQDRRPEIKVEVNPRTLHFRLRPIGRFEHAVTFLAWSAIFLLVHLTLIFTLLSNQTAGQFGFIEVRTIAEFFYRTDAKFFLLAVFLSHLFSFGVNYIGKQENLIFSPKELMVQPIRRVMALHLAILGGALILARLDTLTGFLWILVILKIILDIIAHLEEHRIVPRSTGDDLVTDIGRNM